MFTALRDYITAINDRRSDERITQCLMECPLYKQHRDQQKTKECFTQCHEKKNLHRSKRSKTLLEHSTTPAAVNSQKDIPEQSRCYLMCVQNSWSNVSFMIPIQKGAFTQRDLEWNPSCTVIDVELCQRSERVRKM